MDQLALACLIVGGKGACSSGKVLIFRLLEMLSNALQE